MKKKLIYFWLPLFVFFQSCQKNTPILPKTAALQTVQFNIKGFESHVVPLSTSRPFDGSLMSATRLLSTGLQAAVNLPPKEEEQFLYFWSFNEKSITPTIAVSDQATISISPEEGQLSYTGGYPLAPYEAGQCLNVKGAEGIFFHLPLSGVNQIKQLDFDAGSSATGPKDFRIYYSTDGGQSFNLISDRNPMPDNRNRYTVDLSAINPLYYNSDFLIKLEPLEGSREGANAYNPKTGTFKIDNFRLSGIYNPGEEGTDSPEVSRFTLHYYIFEKGTDTLVTSGQSNLYGADQASSLSIQIPEGQYYALFLSNQSAHDLVLPEQVHEAKDIYVSNLFDNDQAAIFGNSQIIFEVQNADMQVDAPLKRFFSQIQFKFTDQPDLSRVSKLVVTREHQDFIYTPFGDPTVFPPPGPSSITFDQPFSSEGNSLSFYQFMGDVPEPVKLSYLITVYDKNGTEIRHFPVNANIKNNVQLTFEGKLLAGSNPLENFAVTWDENWDEDLKEEF